MAHRTGGARPRSADHRPDIEGLRAVAVVLVVLFHASIGGFGGGFVGVDVFYVISGFLITGLVLRELDATGTVSLTAFYARRARRLLPAAFLVLLATLGLSALVLPPLSMPGVATDTAAAAAYISNIRFAAQATDYFAAGQAPSPVLHYWSLGVEEQFYLFWPAILLLAAGGLARFGRRIGLTIAAITVGSFVFGLWLTSSDAPWAFFSLPARAWELGLGAMLAVAGSRLRVVPDVVGAIAGWAGLLLIGLAAVRFSDATPFPGQAALAPTVGAALVLISGVRPGAFGPTGLLSASVPRFLGRISYSLYLWHWPLLVLPAAAAGGSLPLIARIALVGVAVGLAAMTQRWVEEPFRHGRLVGTRPRLNLASAGAMSLAVVLIATRVGVSAAAGLPGDRAPVNAAANQQSLDSILNALASASPDPVAADQQPAAGAGTFAADGGDDAAGSSPTTGPAAGASTSPSASASQAASPHPSAAPTPRPLRPKTADRRVPGDLQPPLWAAGNDYPQPYFDGCHVQQDGAASGSSCIYASWNAKTTIALFGDSHALAWFPGVERLAAVRGWRMIDLTMSTCTPADLTVYNANFKRISYECSNWRRAALDRLASIRPDIVLVTGTRGISPVDASGNLLAGDDIGKAWQAGMARTLNRLVKIAGRVIVIADTPKADSDPPSCLSQHLNSIVACSTPVSDAINPDWLAREQLAADRAGAGFIDPGPWVCPSSPCPPVIGSFLVFRDAGHLSTAFSAALAGRLGRAIDFDLARARMPLSNRTQ